MKTVKIFIISILSASILCQAQKSNSQLTVRTIAFYNLENMYDTIDDPKKFDDDRTPSGKDRYTSKIYWDKIDKLAKVISEIGLWPGKKSPEIIGLCEVENQAVLEDLVASDLLKEKQYGFVHYDSPDERGMDVALLYQKHVFKPISEKAFPLILFSRKKKRDYTRDQLLVSGALDQELIHILVNHWPSRSGGEARSMPFRIEAAKLNKHIIDSLQRIDRRAKIITMGDMNDDPDSYSIKEVLSAKTKKEGLEPEELFNPMSKMHKMGLNTLAYRDGLNLFDQIIITGAFFEKEEQSFRFFKAGIYNPAYLRQAKGQYRGYPFRSYHNSRYQGGFSDHFPVYIILIKKN